MSLSEKLDALVREHRKYDPAVAEKVEDVAGTTPQRPYALCGEAVRQEEGSVAAVRGHDQDCLSRGEFPSRDCLKADEVLEAALGGKALEASRREHFESCIYCQVLVANSRPDKRIVEQLGRKLAQTLPKHACEGVAADSMEPTGSHR